MQKPRPETSLPSRLRGLAGLQSALQDEGARHFGDARGPRCCDYDDLRSTRGQWRSGVNQQATADAHSHQVAASYACSKKRKATAMTPEERLEKRAAACRLARAKRKRKTQDAAIAAANSDDCVVAAVLDGLIDT